MRRQSDTMRKACSFAACEVGSLEGALASPHREALSVGKATLAHMCANVKACTAAAQVCAAAGGRGHAGGVAGRLAAGGGRRRRQVADAAGGVALAPWQLHISSHTGWLAWPRLPWLC